MTDVEQLLRDTLQGRAATVTDAPPVPEPVDASRYRWLLVAATTAAVLVIGGGVAVWGQPGRGRDSEESGGGYASTCHANLPAAWKTAFASKRVTVDGHSTSVEAITPYGDVVSWTTGGRELVAHVGVRSEDGRTRTVYVGAPGDSVSTSVDGPDLVLSVAPTKDNQPDTTVDDIVAVDLRTFALSHLLTRAAMPQGTVVADKTAEVLDRFVYWAAVPANGGQGPNGVVLAYSLVTGRTRTVGHASLLLSADPRGIYWDGGGVPARGVPASIPKVRSDGYDPVVTDGKDFAWLRAADQQVVGWADSAGDTRKWSVETVRRDGIRSDPIAVSGPFVFLAPLDVTDEHVYVLDTRTGAIADSGFQSVDAGTAYGVLVAVGVRDDDHAPFSEALLDTSRLPALHCR